MTRLDPIEALIADVERGRPVIVVDDEDRENEGDLVLAAERVDAESLAFVIRHTGGVVCLALTNARADHLQLPPMVAHNTARRQTAYTVSIEAREGVDTGISAADRARTIRVASDPATGPGDLARPGHVFPLRARDGGVLRRAGHTEAAVDLARLAGLQPAGIVSELMHDDGTMMRLPELRRFADTHGLKLGSIADLIRHRLDRDAYVEPVATSDLPTADGDFRLHAFRDPIAGTEHVALTLGEIDDSAPLLVRMHSECLTGDALGSLRCDCGAQRAEAMRRIAAEGRGVLVYLRQEGRGIGLLDKVRAYALQDQGHDTVTANAALGLAADLRDYGVGAQILRALGVRRMRLLTNNPRKIRALHGFGLQVTAREPLHVGRNAHNAGYLDTKRDKLGHLEG